MKKALIILLFLPLFSTAQDSSYIVEINGQSYDAGSKAEYEAQMGLSSQSPSGYNNLLIGYKSYWATRLVTFLVNEANCAIDDAIQKGNEVSYFFSTKDQNTAKATFTVTLDKSGRIALAKITGDPAILIKVFIHYWDSNDHSKAFLNKCCTAYKYITNHKMTLDWTKKETAILIFTRDRAVDVSN